MKESKKGIKHTKSKAYKHPKPISRQGIRSTNAAITKVYIHTHFGRANDERINDEREKKKMLGAKTAANNKRRPK